MSLSIPKDIQALQELVIKLIARVESLEAENRLLLARTQALEAENRELRARLDANSRNSHRPPSSEGLRKQPALPKKKSKAKGGQKGHQGKTLEMVSQADRTEECRAEVCSCGQALSKVVMQVLERRQVFELPEPKLEVIEYQRLGCTCPACGAAVSGRFPEGVSAPVQYGAGVKTLTTLLNVQGCLSYEKIRQLFSDLFGYELNEATILNGNERTHQALERCEQQIAQALCQAQSAHFDESGLRVEGRLHWLHSVSAERFTYLFVHDKRGKKALRSEYSLLPHFRGWAIHDCWSSYFTFGECRHAVCGAHLLRELLALQEQKRKWAAAFRNYLLQLYDFTGQGRKALAAGMRVWASRRYDELLALGRVEEPPPEKKKGQRGRAKGSKGYNLLQRLEKYKTAVLAFAFHACVPFTNNQAERDLRPAKVKQKMAGCFRTLRGARIYARIQGFISTVRKHGLNVFKELRAALMGAPHSFAPGGS